MGDAWEDLRNYKTKQKNEVTEEEKRATLCDPKNEDFRRDNYEKKIKNKNFFGVFHVSCSRGQ